MERALKIESAEGEVALVIDYRPGESEALAVLAGAMRLIESLDRMDRCLLSSIDTALEPVSILNDVQHSSLKILLARAVRQVPDKVLHRIDWQTTKEWIGPLLVKGKYVLLRNLESDAPTVQEALNELRADYRAAPAQIAGFEPPRLAAALEAIEAVNEARAALGELPVLVQTELGDVELPRLPARLAAADAQAVETRVNAGREYLKVKSPDMLGQAQWSVLRAGRTIRVDILHRDWLARYQAGEVILLPGDSLDCAFEEAVDYDAGRNEIGRHVAVIEVFGVVRPPRQGHLSLD